MFSHVSLGVNDFGRAFRFYEPLMPLLGLELRLYEPEKPWAIWQKPGEGRPLFFITAPFNGEAAEPGNGAMVAFLAPDRAAVDAVHAKAIAGGGICEGAPGLRPEYHANYYGVYFRDPDGNKLCVCHHDPVAG